MNYNKINTQNSVESPDEQILIPSPWQDTIQPGSPTLVNGDIPSPTTSSPYNVYNTVTSIGTIRSANGTVLRRFVLFHFFSIIKLWIVFSP